MKRKNKKNNTNKKVKVFLTELLSDRIQFCKPHQMNQSLIPFSS